MRTLILIAIVFVHCCLCTMAQDSKVKWFVDGGANVYVPDENTGKSVFPVLGFNSDTSPKLLIGGFQAGAFAWKRVSKELNLKVYANLSRQTYWDPPLYVRDQVGVFNGVYQGWSSDHVITVGGLAHYDLFSNFSAGAGVGVHSLLFSLSKLPDFYGYGVEKEAGVEFNRYYKRVVPVIPIEINHRWKRMMLSLRYELGVINRIKNELGKDVREKYSVLRLNVSFRVGK